MAATWIFFFKKSIYICLKSEYKLCDKFYGKIYKICSSSPVVKSSIFAANNIFVRKSHSLVKKGTNMTIFVLKSHNLVKKRYQTVSFCYNKSLSSEKKSLKL